MECPHCRKEIEDGETLRRCPECGCDFTSARAAAARSRFGRFGLALLIGIPVLLLCGVIWAAIAAWLHMELGYAAIGIGLAAGAVLYFTTREQSRAAGAVAVLLALFGLAAGKILTTEFMLCDLRRNGGTELPSDILPGGENFDEAFSKVTEDYLFSRYENGSWKDPFSDELAAMKPNDPAFAARAAAALAEYLRQYSEASAHKAALQGKPIPEPEARYCSELFQIYCVLAKRKEAKQLVIEGEQEFDAATRKETNTLEEQSAILRFNRNQHAAVAKIRAELRAMPEKARIALVSQAAAENTLEDLSLADRGRIYAGNLGPYDILWCLLALYAAWSFANKARETKDTPDQTEKNA